MESSSRARAPGRRKLEVVQFCADPFLSGAARRLSILLGGLPDQGVETLLVSSHSSRLSVQAVEQGIALRDLALHEVLGPGAFLALWRLFAGRRFDLVHVHGTRAVRLASVAARLAGLPLVRTFDGEVEAPRLARLCVHTAIASTPEARARLEEGGFAPERIRSIPAALDPARLDLGAERELARAAERAGQDDVVVLVLSSLEADRGHGVLLRALARLAEAGIRPRLWIAGDGPAIVEIDRERRELGLAREASFLGRRADVASLLDASDVVVDPGLSARPAIGVLEAMSRGRPVIATEIGGPAHSVVDGKTGLLVRPGDFVALAEALRRLVVDPALRERLGSAGKERVGEGFLLEQVAALHAELYADVAGVARGARMERSSPRP